MIVFFSRKCRGNASRNLDNPEDFFPEDYGLLYGHALIELHLCLTCYGFNRIVDFIDTSSVCIYVGLSEVGAINCCAQNRLGAIITLFAAVGSPCLWKQHTPP